MKRETKTAKAGQFLSVRQFAERLNISKTNVYGMIARGEIPHKRIGKLVRIAADVETIWDVAADTTSSGSS